MSYLALSLISIVAVEIFLWLPIRPPILQLATLGRKIPRVILSPKISDHWKEKVLLKYALLLAINSIKAFLWLLLAVALILGFTAGLGYVFGMGSASALELVASTEGIAIMSLLSIAYYFIRQKLVSS